MILFDLDQSTDILDLPQLHLRGVHINKKH